MNKFRNFAVATVTLICITSTWGYFYLNQKRSTDNTANSSEPVDADMTELREDDNSIFTTSSDDSYIQNEAVTTSETIINTDSITASEPAISSIEETFTPIPVKHLDTVDLNSDEFDCKCITYDPNGQSIYYIFNRQTVKKYDTNSNVAETICKFDEYTELYGLAFNPHTGLLYASAVQRDNSNFVRVPWFIELTKGSDVHYQMGIGQVFFLDNETALLTKDNGCSFFDIATGKLKQSGRVLSSLYGYDYMIPFIRSNSYYYLTSMNGYWYIYHTNQAIPAESLSEDQEFKLSSKSEDILCATTSEDSVYYLSSDLNYCRLNLDRISNAGSENMDDDILIQGDMIENNATNYLTRWTSQLHYISDSCFIAYDESDRTIKLVGQLPALSE